MFVLCSKISITSKKNGDFTFKGVNDLRIKRSIGSYVDTCVIKIPTTAKLNTSSSPTNQAVYSFVAGDAITVDLGYNNEFKKEFKGFVSKVGYSTPVEVECEGYSYLLKRTNFNISWKNTTLRAVCEYITNGTGIKLSPAIPELKLVNYKIQNASATKVLEDLIEQFRLVAYFNFDELYVGLEELAPAGQVAYALGYNTVDTNSLKYQNADDVRLKIVARTMKTDGDRERYTVGDADGSVREIIVKNSETLDQVKKIANDCLTQKKYTGFTGSFTAFGQPYASIGFSCKLKDTRYADRSGTYFVYSIEVSYGMNGFRRIIELTKKLSTNG